MKLICILRVALLPLCFCAAFINLAFADADQELRSEIEKLITIPCRQPSESNRTVEGLKEIGKPAVPILIQIIEEHRTPVSKRDLRLLVGGIAGLGILKDSAGSDVLIDILESKPEKSGSLAEKKYDYIDLYTVQFDAAWALGEIGERRAVDPLIRLLHDAHSDLSAAAAEALGKIGDPTAIPPLEELLQAEQASRAVRQKTTEALVKLKEKNKL